MTSLFSVRRFPLFRHLRNRPRLARTGVDSIASQRPAWAVPQSTRLEVIAEIGTSHSGDLGKARELIRAAKEAGADVAKFQYVIAREIIPPNAGLVPLPSGPVPLYSRFVELERPPEFYVALKEETETAGLEFLCTPFGLGSARALRALAPRRMKVASPELNHLPLLRELSGYGLPLILSSGVSLLGDIERAIRLLGGLDLTLLHCVTSYPAPEKDYNLALLPHYAALFSLDTGVSDHSLDPLVVPLVAVSQGAVAIEKHFTLAKEGPGLDDPVALEPGDFARMAREAKSLAQEPAESRWALVRNTLGAERAEAARGDGRKVLAPSEEANYLRTNRSVHALRDIRAGEVIVPSDLDVLRTEKVLRPGLGPEWLESIYGRRAARDIAAGEGLVWDDL
jgi:sialic acid synthase SpsE